MAFLFDTEAISELFKPRPARGYIEWLTTLPREAQYTSAVVMGELYRGAYRSSARTRHLHNIETRVLPAVTVLPYDHEVARVCGRLQAALELRGTPLHDADLQIGATAVTHGLEIVTGNIRHFERIPDLVVNRVLADARVRVAKGASSASPS